MSEEEEERALAAFCKAAISLAAELQRFRSRIIIFNLELSEIIAKKQGGGLSASLTASALEKMRQP